MAQVTSKQARELLAEFMPQPGYILNLSRKQFAELVEQTTDVDIYDDEQSNSKRFTSLLYSLTDEQLANLVAALRTIKQSPRL